MGVKGRPVHLIGVWGAVFVVGESSLKTARGAKATASVSASVTY